jgi:hypothetical protein
VKIDQQLLSPGRRNRRPHCHGAGVSFWKALRLCIIAHGIVGEGMPEAQFSSFTREGSVVPTSGGAARS